MKNGSHLDAVEAGCSECEREQCDGTVGYGGRSLTQLVVVCSHLLVFTAPMKMEKLL